MIFRYNYGYVLKTRQFVKEQVDNEQLLQSKGEIFMRRGFLKI